ncbi:MAG TPA: phosphopantetheine-binding protein, partial [Mycobacteriales bacterium]
TRTERATALRALGEVWSLGHDVRWPAAAQEPGRRVHLPTYPFAGRSYGALRPGVVATVPVREPATAGPDGPMYPDGVDRPDGSDGAHGARHAAQPQPAATEHDEIADLLATTLGLSGPGDLDLTYVAAGGDSLSAVHIVGRLRDELGIEIPVAMLLEPIPLRELAVRIGAASSDGDDLLDSILGEIESGNDAL